MAQRVRRRTLIGAGAAVLAAPGCTRNDAAGTFLLYNVRVFDGERFIDADSLLVEDGLITAVDRGVAAPAGVPGHDGAGATVLPGLVDAHSHVFGAARANALRFGTTTLLDMFTTDPTWLPGAASARASVAPTDQADVWSSGVGVTAPGGWPDFGQPTLSPEAGPPESAAFVGDRIAEGSDYLKVFIEDGRVNPARSFNSLTDEQVRAVIGAAHDHGVMAVVHVSATTAAETAAAAAADALVHVPTDERFTNAQVEALQAAGLPMVATLSVMSTSGCGRSASALRNEPRVEPLLTPEQRRELEDDYGGCLPAILDRALHNVGALHEAGVPILAGTDNGNPGTTHGASMFGELELLVEAGLTPTEALAAATAVPAAVFGLTDRGRIAPGLRADLMLVDGDPAAELDAIYDIVTIWKNGYQVDREP